MAATCGDSGGLTKAGKPCGVADGLDPATGRCRYHPSDQQASAGKQKEAASMRQREEARRKEWYQLESADIRSFIGQGWRVYIKHGPHQIRGGGLSAA